MSTIAKLASRIAGPRRRWSTEEFDRLVAAGFIREGDRTFLWGGQIIEPMAEDIAHANAADNLAQELRARLSAES